MGINLTKLIIVSICLISDDYVMMYEKQEKNIYLMSSMCNVHLYKI